jgi:CheY-like chemotaxis protein
MGIRLKEWLTAYTMSTKRRILVADDNPLIRKMLCKLFAGHETLEVCDEAVNGQDAVEKARLCSPDLVILDLSMPVMNGLEAATVIRAMLPRIPIILFTLHAALFKATNPAPTAVTRVVSKSEMHTLPKHAEDVLSAA